LAPLLRHFVEARGGALLGEAIRLGDLLQA
jgi:hypothetical protein